MARSGQGAGSLTTAKTSALKGFEMTAVGVGPAQGELTILDFWADWCGVCRLVDPVVTRIAGGRSDIVLKKVNVADEKDVADRHNVAALPTLVFLDEDGSELGRLSGPMTGKQIEAAISDAIGKSG